MLRFSDVTGSGPKGPENTAKSCAQSELHQPLGASRPDATAYPHRGCGPPHPQLFRRYVMLSVWDPFADLNRIQREFEKSYFGPRSRADFAPAVDVHEDAESLVLRAELPGVKKEDVEISIDANVLTLKGERKMEKEEQ